MSVQAFRSAQDASSAVYCWRGWLTAKGHQRKLGGCVSVVVLKGSVTLQKEGKAGRRVVMRGLKSI